MAKALTKMQLAHLSTTLAKAVTTKVEEAKKNFSVYSVPVPSVQEKIALILADKCILIPAADISEYTRFYCAYTTPQEIERAKADKDIAVFRKYCEKAAAEIYEKAVFLGAEEAFTLLKKFQGE